MLDVVQRALPNVRDRLETLASDRRRLHLHHQIHPAAEHLGAFLPSPLKCGLLLARSQSNLHTHTARTHVARPLRLIPTETKSRTSTDVCRAEVLLAVVNRVSALLVPSQDVLSSVSVVVESINKMHEQQFAHF